MALSYVRSVASGSTDTFTVPFPYLDKAHVYVSIDGVELLPTGFTWPTDGTVQLVAGNPPAGSIVERRRRTPADPLVTFAPGNMEAEDFNVADRQSLYLAQEARDISADIEGRAWYTDSLQPGGTITKGAEGMLLVFDSEGNIVPSTGSGPGGLGNSASRDVGTTAGTVAAGDDDRIVNALQPLTGTFRVATFASAESASVPAEVREVYIEAYDPTYTIPATVVGGARYKEVPSEPPHDLKRQIGGRWFEIAERVFDATMAGYVASDSTGDATRNTSALNRGVGYLHAVGGGVMNLPAGRGYINGKISLLSSVWNRGIYIDGKGRDTTTVQLTGAGLAAGDAMLERRAGAAVVLGGGSRNMTWQAAGLADFVLVCETGKGADFRQSSFIGARPYTNTTGSETSNAKFGHPTQPRFYEARFEGATFYNAGSLDASLRPDHNVWFAGYATDSEMISVVAANAKRSNIRVDSGGNAIIGCHPYGSPGTHEADYCIEMNAPTRSIGNYCDGFAVAGEYLNSNEINSVGNKFFWPSSTTGDAQLIASGKSQIYSQGHVYTNKPAARSKVVYVGSQPSSSFIDGGDLGANGVAFTSLKAANVFGSTAANARLNRRLQVLGTDFATSGVGVGRWSNDDAGPFLTLYKSRGTTVGALGNAATSDLLGAIEWAGDAGSPYGSAARIQGRAASGWGDGSSPGVLEFLTTGAGSTSATIRGTLDHRGNWALGTGSLATTATDGFTYIPTMNGTPTGAPTAKTGLAALVVDAANSRLYAYVGGAWKGVTLT